MFATTTRIGPPRKLRSPLGLAVLLLHGLLAWLLLQQPGKHLPPRPAASRMSVRLLPLRLPPPVHETRALPAPQAPSPMAAPRTGTGPGTRTPPPARPEAESAAPAAPPAPQAITLPPTPGASEPSRPLDLTLRPSHEPPPPSLRSQALSDPRTTTPRTPEARMAERLGGDGSLVEENLGDGRHRFRQNGHCVESKPARAGVLDPLAPTQPPTLIGNC